VTHVPRILVLDGEQRSALAAVRSLGRCGLSVSVASAQCDPLAAASRYVDDVLKTPDPTQDVQGWLAAVLHHVSQTGCTLVLPMTDISTMLLAPVKHLFPEGCALLCPPAQAYEALTDKAALLERAAALGMAVPRTLRVATAEHLRSAARQIGYPLVVKPARSRYRLGNTVHATAVQRIDTDAQLQQLIDNAQWLGPVCALVQSWVPGRGAGVFALCGTQGPVAWFAHTRLREKPPAGGVSVLSESCAVNPQLRELSQQLLSAVGWWGPAMIEYRMTPDGVPMLMEVNGRFWGSLQLSIDSGVDFPAILLHLSQGASVPLQSDYRIGQRLRWLLGDLDNLLLQLRGRIGPGTRWTALRSFAATFADPLCRQEIWRSEDPKPAWREAGRWLGALL